MSALSFPSEPAVRENTAFIGAICGPSGSGKTKSALLLAEGLAGQGNILGIDSEGGRMKHYADDHRFFHLEWTPPYTPASLGELLREGERRQFAVIVLDSASSEYDDEGGLQDMAEAQLQLQKDKGWELNSASAWAYPKAEHKYHVIRWLRQTRCHVIFCCRAQDKVRFEKSPKGKTVVVPIGFSPICEKNLLYEVTTSVLLTPDAPGVPKPIKLYEKHRRFFPLDKPISREYGRLLAEWCAGGLRQQGQEAARAGLPALEKFWMGLAPAQRKALGRSFLDGLKAGAPLLQPEFTEADRRASYERAGVPLEDGMQSRAAAEMSERVVGDGAPGLDSRAIEPRSVSSASQPQEFKLKSWGHCFRCGFDGEGVEEHVCADQQNPADNPPARSPAVDPETAAPPLPSSGGVSPTSPPPPESASSEGVQFKFDALDTRNQRAPGPEPIRYAIPMVMRNGRADLVKWVEGKLLPKLLAAKTSVEVALIQGDNHEHIAAYKATLKPLEQKAFESELIRIAEEVSE